MSILEPKRIENWPDNRRWSYPAGNYRALGGIKIGDDNGTLTFLFGLTWRDRLRLLFGRGVYVSVMTFGEVLQPMRVDTAEPEFVAETRQLFTPHDRGQEE